MKYLLLALLLAGCATEPERAADTTEVYRGQELTLTVYDAHWSLVSDELDSSFNMSGIGDVAGENQWWHMRSWPADHALYMEFVPKFDNSNRIVRMEPQ